jgi:hypothetical protein
MDLGEFFVRDYEIKGTYLSDHHTRMWNRFNIFASLESVLLGGGFILNMAGRDGWVNVDRLAVVGAVLSLVWLAFSWLDREVLRSHGRNVQKAFDRIKKHFEITDLKDFKPVGAIAVNGGMDELNFLPQDLRKRLPEDLQDRRELAKALLLFLPPTVALVAWVLLAALVNSS